ncbi:MAG: hypothetical protein ACOZNI_25195 [Myxococcota bacterium]
MKVLTSTTGVVAAVIVAAALGLPVGSWAALGAMACFGIGCLGFMLGGEELGKALRAHLKTSPPPEPLV